MTTFSELPNEIVLAIHQAGGREVFGRFLQVFRWLNDFHVSDPSYARKFIERNTVAHKEIIVKDVAVARTYTTEFGEIHGKHVERGIANFIKTVSYYHHGKLHGPLCTTNDNVITLVENYCDGVLHGPKTFDLNGTIKIMHYDYGKRHGPYQKTHFNKNIKKCNYVNGLIEGQCERGGKHPFIRINAYYVNGVLHGPYEEYDELGVTTKCTYKNGKREGQSTSYYSSARGGLKMKCNYVQGRLDGQFQTFNVNGAPELRCNYVNGYINGTCHRWRRNVTVHESVEYIYTEQQGEYALIEITNNS